MFLSLLLILPILGHIYLEDSFECASCVLCLDSPSAMNNPELFLVPCPLVTLTVLYCFCLSFSCHVVKKSTTLSLFFPDEQWWKFFAWHSHTLQGLSLAALSNSVWIQLTQLFSSVPQTSLEDEEWIDVFIAVITILRIYAKSQLRFICSCLPCLSLGTFSPVLLF